jgi:hypothetical protein
VLAQATSLASPAAHLIDQTEVATMGKLMRKIKKAAKSPKAKELEKKMMKKAKDPKTKTKISNAFQKLKAKH